MSTGSVNRPSSAPRPLSVGWWTGERGLAGLAQRPNPALGVWLGVVLLRWTGVGGNALENHLVWLGRGALVVWSLDELLRGANPFRRLMGAAVLTVQAVRLFG